MSATALESDNVKQNDAGLASFSVRHRKNHPHRVHRVDASVGFQGGSAEVVESILSPETPNHTQCDGHSEEKMNYPLSKPTMGYAPMPKIDYMRVILFSLVLAGLFGVVYAWVHRAWIQTIWGWLHFGYQTLGFVAPSRATNVADVLQQSGLSVIVVAKDDIDRLLARLSFLHELYTRKND
jgi:hypothetical protein